MLLIKENSALLVIDMQEVLMPAVMNSFLSTQKTHWLMQLAKKLNIPTLVSEQYPKGLGHTVTPLNNQDLALKICPKVHFSSVKDDDTFKEIQQTQKNQWVLAGIETHVCVLQTAIDLSQAGYGVYVVVDAVSARHEIDHKYGLKRMKQHDIELVTSEMVFFEWVKQAGTAEFKELSKQFFKEK